MPDEAAIADPPEQDVPDQSNPTDAPASVQAQSTPKENEVVSRFKKVYPAYEKFSNNELTPRIAAAYPQFLKNKPFAEDFSRIQTEQARESKHEDLMSQMAAAQGETEKANKSVDRLSTLERNVEPFTGVGIANQPARAANLVMDLQDIPHGGDPIPHGPTINIPQPKGDSALAGVGRVAAKFGSSLTDFDLLVQLPAGAVAAGRALFAAQIGKELPDQIENAFKVLSNPKATRADKVEAVGDPAVATTILGLIAHGGQVKIPKDLGEIARDTQISLADNSDLPATAKVLQEISSTEPLKEVKTENAKEENGKKEGQVLEQSVGAKVDESNPAKTVAVPTEAPTSPNAVAEAKTTPEGTVVKPAEATAPEPTEPIPGERLMTVQRPDGTTYKVSFSDKYWDDGKKMPSVARLTPEGQWSHGMLKKGEKFVEEPKSPEPTKSVEPVGTTDYPITSSFMESVFSEYLKTNIAKMTGSTMDGLRREFASKIKNGDALGFIQEINSNSGYEPVRDFANREFSKLDEAMANEESASENVSTTPPTTGDLPGTDTQWAGTADISGQTTTEKGKQNETVKSTTEGNGTVQSDAEKANADAQAREAGHADEQAQNAPSGDEGVKGPGLVAMGGDLLKSADPERGGGSPTAMKYKLIDQERQQRGLPPLTKLESVSDQAVMDRAMAEIDRDPSFPDKLIAELNSKPRAIEDWENHVLMLRKIDLREAYEKSAREAARAYEDSAEFPDRKADMVRANIETARLSDELQKLETASRVSGSARGRALRSLQVMANEDYSLASLETQRRAAKGGAPLTDAERAQLKKVADDYAKANAELEKHLSESQQKNSELQAKAELDRIALEAAKPVEPHLRIIADKVKGFFDAQAESALARIKKRRSEGRLFTGIDPVELADYAVYGASKILAKGISGAEMTADWAKSMTEEIGDYITPHLQGIWKAAQKRLDDHIKRVAGGDSEKVKRIVKKDAPVEERKADTVAAIEAKQKSGKLDEINPLAQKLARIAIEQGAKGWREITDAVHGVLKTVMPEWDYRDTMDAISGHGKFTIPSKDEISKQLSDAKSQINEIRKIQEVIAREPVKPTGFQRGQPSDTKRRLTQIYEEMKRRFGVVVTNPEAQLRSALQARKTYYENRISDLQHEIDAKQRTVKTKTPPPSDAALEALKAEYQKVKSEHDSIFGDRETTDEQRLKRALSAAERAESSAEAELTRAEKGDFTKSAGKPLPESESLNEVKARTAAMREQTKLLRDLDTHFQEQKRLKEQTKQLSEIDSRIEEVTRQINEGDITAKKPAAKSVIPELEQKRGELAELNKIKAKLQAAEKAKTPAEREAAKVTAVQERIDEVSRQINEGDIAARKRGVSTASPERVSLQEELKELNKIKSKLRAAEKAPTVAERETKTNEALQARSDEVARQINEGDTAPKTTTPKAVSASTEALRGELADLNKVRQQLRNAAKPKKTPEEIAAQSFVTRTTNRIAELEKKLADKDFSRKPKRELVLDRKAQELKAKTEAIAKKFKSEQLKEELKNRPLKEKIFDTISNARRFSVLSGANVLLKLAAYSATKVPTMALEEVAGGVLFKLPYLKQIASKAPSEGGSHLPALVRSVAKGLTQGFVDAKKTLMTGTSDLKSAFSPKMESGYSWHQIPQIFHEAVKSPLRRTAFEFALEKRMDAAAKAGADITDPLTQLLLSKDAYMDSDRALLLEQNRAASSIRGMFSRWEAKDKNTGEVPLAGKAAATLGRVELPILTVPFNYAKQALTHAFGVISGTYKLRQAFKRGIDTLKPEERDQIARHFKKGAIGAAAALYGFYDGYNNGDDGTFGGFYQRGHRPREDQAKPGGMRIAGHNISSVALHNPVIYLMQMMHTIGAVTASKVKKTGEPKGITAGMIAGGMGLLDDAPTGRPFAFVDSLKSGDPARKFQQHVAEWFKPTLLNEAAKEFDKTVPWYQPFGGEIIPRESSSFKEDLMMGVPGLRNQLPEKIEKPARAR